MQFKKDASWQRGEKNDQSFGGEGRSNHVPSFALLKKKNLAETDLNRSSPWNKKMEKKHFLGLFI